MALHSINPATGGKIAQYKEFTIAEVEQTIAAVDRAFHEWRTTTFPERAAYLQAAGRLLRKSKDEFGKMISSDPYVILADAADRDLIGFLDAALADVGRCRLRC